MPHVMSVSALLTDPSADRPARRSKHESEGFKQVDLPLELPEPDITVLSDPLLNLQAHLRYHGREGDLNGSERSRITAPYALRSFALQFHGAESSCSSRPIGSCAITKQRREGSYKPKPYHPSFACILRSPRSIRSWLAHRSRTFLLSLRLWARVVQTGESFYRSTPTPTFSSAVLFHHFDQDDRAQHLSTCPSFHSSFLGRSSFTSPTPLSTRATPNFSTTLSWTMPIPNPNWTFSSASFTSLLRFMLRGPMAWPSGCSTTRTGRRSSMLGPSLSLPDLVHNSIGFAQSSLKQFAHHIVHYSSQRSLALFISINGSFTCRVQLNLENVFA